MKKVIVLFVCLYTSLSNPVKNADFTYRVELENGNITYESNIIHQNYSYKVETSDGTIRTEKGHLENNSLVVEGTYEYLGENNFKYAVTYLADKNGYHPKMIFDFGAENITHKGDPPHRTTTTKTTSHSATTEKANSTTAKPKGKN